MSEKDNFGTGFLLGTIIGGVVGGIIGTVITNKNNANKDNNWRKESEFNTSKYSSFDDDEIDNSRETLEAKINQLNHAIDQVRVTLLKNSPSEIMEE